MHNNDIGMLCITMTSATFKSLYGNAKKRLELPQIREKLKKIAFFRCCIGSFLGEKLRFLFFMFAEC